MIGALENDVRIWSIFIFIFVWLMAILKLSIIVWSSFFDGLFAWYGRCTIRRFWLISFDFVEPPSNESAQHRCVSDRISQSVLGLHKHWLPPPCADTLRLNFSQSHIRCFANHSVHLYWVYTRLFRNQIPIHQWFWRTPKGWLPNRHMGISYFVCLWS